MRSTTQVSWGIMGTGAIAARFADDVHLLDGHRLAAVGSRDAAKAEAFARAHGAAAAHPSYEALATDPNVDVVYVATPHPLHHPNARLALEAGKHVLVEKPFTMDAAEAADLVAFARQRGLFLMEAMWTRFLPHVDRIRAILASGALGRIIAFQADHGQWFPEDPAHRLFAPELGGGALLDLGIYPVSFSSLVLGAPNRVLAAGTPTMTGVDASTSIILGHDSGAQAVLHTTLSAAGPNRAAIIGTDARIEIDGMFFCPTSFTVLRRDGTVAERYAAAYAGAGLREQAREVARCLAAGLGESPLLPLDESVSIMRTLDEIRRQTGLAPQPRDRLP